jgi:hypothetical protein
MGRHGDAGTRSGDAEMRGRVTASPFSTSPRFLFSASPVSASPCPPSPHPRVSASPLPRFPVSRFSVGRTCARRRYVIIQPPLPKELALPNCSRGRGWRQRKRMLKRISDATSQSNITEFPLASDSYRSHQSHCNCNLTSSKSLPGSMSARFDLCARHRKAANPRRGAH